jgi:DNA-binding beta-propeller fold protein YncE
VASAKTHDLSVSNPPRPRRREAARGLRALVRRILLTPPFPRPSFLVLAALLVAGCARPAGFAPGPRLPLLYVANAADGTITRLDAVSGRVVGRPLPAGPAPGQVAAGPGGALLVLSLASRPAARLTHVVPAGSGWSIREVRLDGTPGDVLLAGDGQRHAAAAYPVRTADPAAPPCRLAVVDVATGAVVGTRIICAARESLHSLALERTAAGLVAYVGLWRAPTDAGGRPLPGSGAIVAVETATGAVAGRTGMAGVPEHLLLAAAPGHEGPRLYAVEGTPGPEARNPGVPSVPGLDAGAWRLVGIDPATLDVESVLPLGEQPGAVTVTPDGNDAYVRAARGRTVAHVDLRTGRSRPLVTLPGLSAGGPVVSGERLYAPDSLGSAVWAVDRRRGRLAQTIPVGRRPLGITLAHP